MPKKFQVLDRNLNDIQQSPPSYKLIDKVFEGNADGMNYSYRCHYE